MTVGRWADGANSTVRPLSIFKNKEDITMADIKNTVKTDAKEVKTATSNSTGSKESSNITPTNAGQASNKSIGNQSEAKKDTNESTAQTGKTAVVRYVGTSIWKDEKGNFWSKEDQGESILAERQMPADEYEKRADLKFMVGYGEMKVSFVK